MARKVSDLDLQIPDVEDLTILEKEVKSFLEFLSRDAVALPERLLDSADAFADTDRRPEPLLPCQSVLKVRCRSEMVCMGMRLQHTHYSVVFRVNQGQQTICCLCADRLR